MSKTPVQFTVAEVPTSAKFNEAIQDYITRGHIWSNDADATAIWIDAGATPQTMTANDFPIAAVVYNPDKSLFDTVRFAWRTLGAGEAGTVTPSDIEYTLDSGVTWTALVDVLGFPVTGLTGSIGVTGTPTSADGMRDVSLSGIVTTEWLGIRADNGTADNDDGIGGTDPGSARLNTFVHAIMYDSTAGFDPF